MGGYTPLFSSIVTSSVWTEDDPTRIVWITLLALADAQGKVEGSVPGIAQVANVSLDACQSAIEKLKAPDKYSRTKEHEGRRIREIEGGWLVLNHQKFRERAKSRAEYYRNYRQRKKEKSPHTPKEKEQTINTHTNSETAAQHANSCATVARQVEEFWNAYPKKVGKPEVREWFSSHSVSDELFGTMLSKIGQLRTTDEWRREGGRFIPHPIKWLERGGWDDAPTSPVSMPTHRQLPIIPGKVCSQSGCGMPALYKSTGGQYDHYYCEDHMPEKVRAKYCPAEEVKP